MGSRAVIFDLFDTLVPGGTSQRRAMIGDMARDLGIDPGRFQCAFRDSYRERFAGELGDVRQTITTLSRRCGVDPDPAGVERAARGRLDYTLRLLMPYPGVLDVLSTLACDGWKLGLVTNCSNETEQMWPQTALAQLIDTPVFSCQVGQCKPDPAIYRLAADGLGIAPRECVYVADGAGGELAGARNLGMATIRVHTDDVDHATFGGIGDWTGTVIDDLTQLARHLPKP